MPTLWIIAQPSADLVEALPVRPDDVVHQLAGAVGPGIGQHHDDSGRRSTLAVAAGSLAALRLALPVAAQAGAIRELRLYLEGPRSIDAVHHPVRAVGKASLQAVAVAVHDDPTPHVRLVVKLRRPAPAGHVLAACLGRPPSVFGPPTLGLRIGILPAASLAWAAGDVNAAVVDQNPQAPAQVDVVVAGAEPPQADGALPDVAAIPDIPAINAGVGGPRWAELAVAPHQDIESAVKRMRAEAILPPVDTDVLSPAGLWANAAESGAATMRRLRSSGDLVVQHDDGHVVARIPTTATLWESHVDPMRGLRTIKLGPEVFEGPFEEAAFLAQAACAALPVVTGSIAGPARDQLGDELAAAIERGADVDRDDDIEFESWLVRMHREAFRRLRLRAVWRRHGLRMGLPVPPTPSVSVVVATRRPERVRTILEQVARQTWPELEVVLGLHGCDIDDPVVKSALDGFGRPCVVRQIDQRLCLGQVLQELTHAASGDFITKMDDDDWYGLNHVTDLVYAAEFSGAVITGCGAEFVYLSQIGVTIRRQARSGHSYTPTIAGGSLLIRVADLRAVGGWRPVPRAVDTALISTVAAAGGDSYRTHGLGFVLYRGAVSGHTWGEGPDYFLRRANAQWTGIMAPPELDGTGVPDGW